MNHSARRTILFLPIFTAVGTAAIAIGVRADGEAPASAASTQSIVQIGVKSLLDQIVVEAVVRYKRPGHSTAEVRGRVASRSIDELVLELPGGEKVTIPRSAILRTSEQGEYLNDLPAPNNGGPMALACYALLAAGLREDEPTLAALLRTLEMHPMPGTYARGLRACVLARRIEQCGVPAMRGRLRRLLNDDVRWLLNAMKVNGYYGYGGPDNATDNSVTQFANLGMSAAAEVFAEVPGTYWRTVEEHWLSTQREDGGWSYSPSDSMSKPSMTIAGANSLYLVLDRRYPRLERAYVRFRGAVMSPSVQMRRASLFRAIQRADDYLRSHPPDIEDYMGYNLFGLERLGVASGRAKLGGQEWHRMHIQHAADRKWGVNGIADSFSLVYLVHGLAPVWIQKLDWGTNPDASLRYERDLHFLTRHLNFTLESLLRWQIIDESASVESMLAAPLLYIAGESMPKLSDETWTRIHDYVTRGGTLFLHADRASYNFNADVGERIEQVFSAEGLRWRDLPADHPLYRLHFGRGTGGWYDRPPLKALGDGRREFVILSPTDIAGAWHQNLTRRHPDLFGLMVNMHLYVTAERNKRPKPPQGTGRVAE